MGTADDLVARWLVREYRARMSAHDNNAHLRGYRDLAVEWSGRDETYDCDTGCEHLVLSVTMTCSHGRRETFEYGTFGHLASLIETLESGDGKQITVRSRSAEA